MSSSESMATPVRPTSPRASSWSESRPSCVGRSKATDRPVWPRSSSRWNRSLVSPAEPNPAYWRIVQARDRYPSARTPRVYGNSPGSAAGGGACAAV